MAENERELRACCVSAHETLGAAAPLFSSAIPRIFNDLDELPVVDVPRERGSFAIAAHEIGHAAVALAVGGTIGEVSIEDGLYVARVDLPENVAWRLNVAMRIAGDVAANWSSRRLIPLHREDIRWTLNAVRSCGGGHCDLCDCIRMTVVKLRHPPDEVVIAEIRHIERITQDFVVASRNWFWISNLSSILKERGTMTGKEIGDILPSYDFDVSALKQLND